MGNEARLHIRGSPNHIRDSPHRSGSCIDGVKSIEPLEKPLWSERDKIITPYPRTPTLQSRDDKMIREAMSELYETEYDAVIATVRIYALVFMSVITLIVSAVLL